MISYAWDTRQAFYPTVVYLVTSKVCIVCLGNQALVLTLLVGRSVMLWWSGDNRYYAGRVRRLNAAKTRDPWELRARAAPLRGFCVWRVSCAQAREF